jgi:hypothetical protein
MDRDSFDTTGAIIATIRNEGSIDYDEALELMKGAYWSVARRLRIMKRLLDYKMLRNIPEFFFRGI